MQQQLPPDKIKHVLAVTRSVNTMVVFENCEGDDTLALTTEDIEERPVTTWWTRSRFVTVLSVASCLLTSLAVYFTSQTGTLNNQVKQKQGQCQYVLIWWMKYL